MRRFAIIMAMGLGIAAARAGDVRITPRIESVAPAARQPEDGAKTTIWFDDFNGAAKAYTESAGEVDKEAGLGGGGGAMLCLYEKDKQGEGNRKVFFGDSPTGKVVRKGEKFDEIYWRIYVKHQMGWSSGQPDRGGPDKMSRATSMASANWTQAMIAHVWSTGDTLTLDPAGGVVDGKVVTTRYNDFANLHWLGNKPAATFPIHSGGEAGWWVCVESRAKLNTPGKKDGINQLWIDGRLEAERRNLDWRGAYDGKGINAVFLEAYWNKTSPVTQRRWYDNFVISTEPIGPVTCGRNAALILAPAGEAKVTGWMVEIAEDGAGRSVVFRSTAIGGDARVTIEEKSGRFEGTLAGKKMLDGDKVYFCRVKQKTSGEYGEWSPWHQPFHTEK